MAQEETLFSTEGSTGTIPLEPESLFVSNARVLVKMASSAS